MNDKGQSGKIRVILIDDHRFVHETVALALARAEDIVLVAQGGNGQEALQLCQHYKPDLILMDVIMPVMNGVEATRLISEQHPEIKILALSSFQDDDSVRAMMAYGAVGYVLKGSIVNDLVTTIRATQFGKVVFSPEVTATLLTSPKRQSQDFGLTQRELEVLRLMAEGLNNGEIAARLTISQSTVKFHIANVIHKLGVDTRTEAIVLAAKNNLI
jgi:two-component system, NarL family, response regulator LiaR